MTYLRPCAIALCAALVAASPPAAAQPLSGAIYIADSGNHRIVRIDDISGAGWATLGDNVGHRQFLTASDLFVDPAGRIYVSDTDHHRIVRIDPGAGSLWLAFGRYGRGAGQFDGPTGIFVDSAGYIYVADSGNNRIVRMDDMTGNGWTTLGTEGRGVNQFLEPTQVSVSGDGQIYVADRVLDGGEVRVVRINDFSGAGWTEARVARCGSGSLLPLRGELFVDRDGSIYLADAHGDCVLRFGSMTETRRVAYGTKGSGIGQFDYPTDIFVDTAGRIYVVDASNSRLVRMDNLSGAGWTSMPIETSRQLCVGEFVVHEAEVFVDQSGRIYILGGDRVVRVNGMSGEGRTVFGSRVRIGPRQFEAPWGRLR